MTLDLFDLTVADVRAMAERTTDIHVLRGLARLEASLVDDDPVEHVGALTDMYEFLVLMNGEGL